MLYEIEGLLGSEQRKGLATENSRRKLREEKVLRLAEVNDLASLTRHANWIDAFNHEKERANLALPAHAFQNLVDIHLFTNTALSPFLIMLKLHVIS